MADYVRVDNLTIQQGDDRPLTWTLSDSAGAPVDLTGYTTRAQVRDSSSSSSAVLHEWSTALSNAVLTESSVALKVDDSETWTWVNGVYDLLITDPAGTTEVLARGSVVVIPGITR